MASRPQRLRIGIVGAGAIGLVAALRLQRDGHDVEMFDRLGPGEGASSGNSGIIAECEVIPFNRPDTLRGAPRLLLQNDGPLAIRWRKLPALAPWLLRFALASRPSASAASARELAAMLPGAGEAWRRVVAGTGAAALLENRGWLKIALSQASLEAASRLADAQAVYGVESGLLSADQVRALEPGLSAGIAGAVFYPGVSSMRSPLRVMQLLSRRFADDGGIVHCADVTAIGVTDDHAWIEMASGRQKFDRIVLAAGAWSKRLAAMIGETVALGTERGYHVMLRMPPVALTRPVSVLSPAYTMAPMEDGLRIASGIEFADLEAPADLRRIKAMARHATTLLPGLDATPISSWLGFRPSMPDALPVVRHARANSRVILSFGHGHLGVTLAPHAAELVASLVATPP